MSFKRKKVSVIGAGNTGSTTALMIAEKELANVVLLDIKEKENNTKGKALDMLEASPVLGLNVNVLGTSNYENIKDSDLVVITAGIPRKPGMSRDELVLTNVKIIKTITKQIVKYAPNCFILVLTNPVDVMTYTVLKESGFEKNRVIGQSGVLDTARFRSFVAQELNISVKDVTGFVLGGHGDKMVPLIRYSYAGGIPLNKLIAEKKLTEIIERTRKGGGEIVKLLGNGSAYYAPAAALTQMVEAILKAQRRILPTIAYLEGEYGYSKLCLGVPTILGGNGIEEILELELTNDEKAALDKSVDSVKKVINII